MKKLRFYYLLLFILIVVYCVLSFTIPTDSAVLTKYGITVNQARILNVAVIVPYVVIWYIAFFGFIRIKQYVYLIHQNRDGKAWRVISNGLMLLAISLPFSAILANIRQLIIIKYPSLTPMTTIVYNYLTLALVLVGAWFAAYGSRRLMRTLGKIQFTKGQLVLILFFVLFCLGYTYITLTDPARRIPGEMSGTAAYYLPDFLVFSTIVVPYILLWFLGLQGAYYLNRYRKLVSGVLYKKALGYVAFGIVFVILSFMVLRLTVSMSSFLNDLTLKYILAFIYVLLFIIGIGYVFIAIGAKKLKKIEEV